MALSYLMGRILGVLRDGAVIASSERSAAHEMAKIFGAKVDDVRRALKSLHDEEKIEIDGDAFLPRRVAIVRRDTQMQTAEGKRQKSFATDDRGYPIPAVIRKNHPRYGKYVGKVTIRRMDEMASGSSDERAELSGIDKVVEEAHVAFETLRDLAGVDGRIPTKDAIEKIAVIFSSNDGFRRSQSHISDILSLLARVGAIERGKLEWQGVSVVKLATDSFPGTYVRVFALAESVGTDVVAEIRESGEISKLAAFLRSAMGILGDGARIPYAPLLEAMGVSAYDRRLVTSAKLSAHGIVFKPIGPGFRTIEFVEASSPEEERVGEESLSPSTSDSHGGTVLAKIDGLLYRIRELEEENASLRVERDTLKAELRAIEERL